MPLACFFLHLDQHTEQYWNCPFLSLFSFPSLNRCLSYFVPFLFFTSLFYIFQFLSVDFKIWSLHINSNNWLISSLTSHLTQLSLSPNILEVFMLLSHFSRVRLCAIPQTAAYQAPPSLGFSRQEHWSELPFPSPMHESEKGKWSHSVMSDS